LEIVYGQNDLSAAASDGFSFTRATQYCSKALSSVSFVHPERRKLTTSPMYVR